MSNAITLLPEGSEHETLVRRSWSDAFTLLTLLCLATGIVFRETVVSIVSIWQISDTFGHGFLVVPVFLWLVARRRDALKALKPEPAFLPVFVMIPVGLLWLAGSKLGIQVIEQLAFVVLCQLMLWSVLGHTVSRTILFPLLFLVFAAPVGDELVPLMMDITADFTVAIIQWMGIPIFREGLYFSLSSGHWSVVEACSGIRYLIASVMLCSVFSCLVLETIALRAIFLVLAVIIPIVANGFRAVMIVMLAHFSDNELAAGVDHLVYGWVFFGFVMALLFSLGLSLARIEPSIRSNVKTVVASHNAEELKTRSAVLLPLTGRQWYVLCTAGVVMCALSWPLIERFSDDNRTASAVSTQVQCQAPGLQSSGTRANTLALQANWQPGFSGYDHCLQSHIGPSGVNAVRATVLSYESQGPGQELVGWHNVLVSRTDDDWELVSTERLAEASYHVPSLNRSVVRSEGRESVVWWWYQFGESIEASKTRALLRNAWVRLLPGPTNAKVVFLEASNQNGRADERLHNSLSYLSEIVSVAAAD